MLFVRREENYYLIEVWSVLGKRVVTAEFEHRGETNNEQREARLVYSWMGVSSHAIGIYCWRTKTKCIPVQSSLPSAFLAPGGIVASTNVTISTDLSAGSHFIDSRILFDSGAHRVNT